MNRRSFLLGAGATLVATKAAAEEFCPVRRGKCADPDDRSCPPQCRRDLSDIDLPIHRLPIDGQTAGLWLGPPMLGRDVQRSIVINSSMSRCIQQQAQHHEKCHELLYRLTGNHWFHY